MAAERGGNRFSGGMKENYNPPPGYTPPPSQSPPSYTPPPSQTYTPPQQPPQQRGSVLTHPTTGRAVFTGPNGEPGYAPGSPMPSGVQVTWTMPDGRTASYLQGATPDPGNLQALQAWGGGTPTAPGGGPAPTPTTPGGSPGTSPAPTTPTTPGAPNPAETSGIALFKAALAQFGIEVTGDLLAWAKGKVTSGAQAEEILIEFRSRPEHKARFGAFHELAGTQWAISEGQQLELENSYRTLMHSYGIPEGFYDSIDDLTEFITSRTSPAELRDRLEAYVEDFYNADPAILDELGRRGLGFGEMIAGYIDPDRALPLIEKAQRSARIGAAATRTGFGFVPLGVADDLDALGVSQQQAQEGFSELVQAKELFTGLTGTQERGFSLAEQVDSQFIGGNSAAARRQRQAQRKAVFEAGGGSAAGRDGIVGLSSASN